MFAVDTWRWAGCRSASARARRSAHPVRRSRSGSRPPARPGRTRRRGPRQPAAHRPRPASPPDGPQHQRAGRPVHHLPGHARHAFGPGELFEYGEALRGVLEDEKPLSVRDDMSVESWRIVQPVLDAWRDGRVPLEEYQAGSAGPAAWEDRTP
ncbi:hypothetical protein ACR6C2_25035 [Streptomyces sp. INA 01156]